MNAEQRNMITNVLNNISNSYSSSNEVNLGLLVQTKMLFDKISASTFLASFENAQNELESIINDISFEKISIDELNIKYSNFIKLFDLFNDEFLNAKNLKLSFVYPTARIEMAVHHAKMILEYNGDVDIEVILCHNYNQEINEIVEIDIQDSRFKYIKNDHTPYEPTDVRSYTYNVIEALKSATGDYVFPLSDKDYIVKEHIDHIYDILSSNDNLYSIKSALYYGDIISCDFNYEVLEKGYPSIIKYFINYSLSGVGYKKDKIDFDMLYGFIDKNEESVLTYIQAYLGFDMCKRGKTAFTNIIIAIRDFEYIKNNNVRVANNGVPMEGYLMRPYTPRGRFEVFKSFLTYFNNCNFTEQEFNSISDSLIDGYFDMINSAYLNDNEYKNFDEETLINNLSEFRLNTENLFIKYSTSIAQCRYLLESLYEKYSENLHKITITKETIKNVKFDFCKICNSTIYLDNPIIKFENVPDRSQNLLKSNELQNENVKNLEVYQCKFCNTVQLLCNPLDKYEEVIRASSVSKIVKNQKTEQFQDFIDKYDLNGKRILEIGSGNGDYLEIMNSLNVDAYGIEYSKENVDACVQKGLSVTQDYIFAAYHRAKPFYFDAFYCINYLEHIPTPNIFLKGIYNNTKDDAVGIIEVPNFDMMIENGLYSEFVFDHLVYYTKETLTLLLNKSGFDVLEYNSTREDYVLSVIVRKKERTNFNKIIEKSSTVTNDVQNYINEHNNVVVWGAGHQSFFVLSQINNYSKIKYIFDSADFKQGKISPTTHIPIIAPNFSKNIDAILVIGGSYSDEIVEIIKSNDNYKGKVAKLTADGLVNCN